MNDVKELKEVELEKVTGGLNVGDIFSVASAWPGTYQGEWFGNPNEPDFAYNVCTSAKHSTAFIANRYWHKDGEVWPYGTCSFGVGSYLRVIETPSIIHTKFTRIKPF